MVSASNYSGFESLWMYNPSPAIYRSLCSHDGFTVSMGVKHQEIFQMCLHSFVQVPETCYDFEKLCRARLPADTVLYLVCVGMMPDIDWMTFGLHDTLCDHI